MLLVISFIIYYYYHLQVVVNPERGLLKDVLHNETVELETEMVVAIMKDVSSALKYLHQLDPPILDKDLTSSGVMLNVDYCAQLVHLHHNNVRPCCSLRHVKYWPIRSACA